MNRLDYITSMLDGYNSVCDVGTDHGFVPINAIEKYNLDCAYALDVNNGPLENAKKNILKNGLENKIKPILSDGLKNFDYPVDVIVIAGMGGALIKDILSTSREKALKAKALILSPNKEEDIVREFLANNGFKIEFEHLLKDNNHYYEIIKAIPGEMKLTDLDISYGPFLRKEKSPLFIEKWTCRKKIFEEASSLCQNDKRLPLEAKIKEIEGVL